MITLFNGEGYIKPVIRSIQNQNFINWELIIVDDSSSDNSIELVKEIMGKEERIKLLKNSKNMGTLHTKMRGIIFAKGKYILSLDQDNLYSNKNVLNILYRRAEKYNIELLGFSTIIITLDMKYIKSVHNYFETHIIRKPNIKDRFFQKTKDGKQSMTFLCLYFIRAELFHRLIKKIDKSILNRNIDQHDDSILMFLLSREANSFKHIKKICHVILIWPNNFSSSIPHQLEIKIMMREKKKCYSYLTFIEVVLLYTESNIKDKEFAGKIHVHHKEPLGSVKDSHTVNPETDLIPVCPNCHMILHSKKDGVYLPEEVVKMIEIAEKI